MAQQPGPSDVLRESRASTLRMLSVAGEGKTKKLLEHAARDLRRRIREVKPGAEGGFAEAQMRATLRQVEHVTRDLTRGMRTHLLDQGDVAAEKGVENTAAYLRAADKKFRGVGQQPIAMDEARMFESAQHGVRASLLMRLAMSGEVPEAGAFHPAKLGVLQRYGVETIGEFQGILQRGMLTRKPWGAVADELTEASPFLQGKPASWAARIVRTETMGAYGRASWESVREVNEEVDDMLKILCAHFDDRTGADSYAVHGQIRRPDEAFESWFGLYQHPPNRPNDREIVVPHRMAWPLPEALAPRGDDEVAQAWLREGRKGAPPPRPLMSTVDMSGGG